MRLCIYSSFLAYYQRLFFYSTIIPDYMMSRAYLFEAAYGSSLLLVCSYLIFAPFSSPLIGLNGSQIPFFSIFFFAILKSFDSIWLRYILRISELRWVCLLREIGNLFSHSKVELISLARKLLSNISQQHFFCSTLSKNQFHTSLLPRVFPWPTTIRRYLERVRVTLIRRSSTKNPTSFLLLALTVDTIMMSFSCPWKESTVLIMTLLQISYLSSCRSLICFLHQLRIILLWAWQGVMTPRLTDLSNRRLIRMLITRASSMFQLDYPIFLYSPYLMSRKQTFLLSNSFKNSGIVLSYTCSESISLFWQNLELGNCLIKGAMRYWMLRKQGLMLASKNRSKRDRLNRVTLASALIQVAGSWQGSPMSMTLSTPVCRAIKRFGSVACAASSTIRQAISPLMRSSFSLPVLLRVVSMISALLSNQHSMLQQLRRQRTTFSFRKLNIIPSYFITSACFFQSYVLSLLLVLNFRIYFWREMIAYFI